LGLAADSLFRRDADGIHVFATRAKEAAAK
jgi:hypothetical protein